MSEHHCVLDSSAVLKRYFRKEQGSTILKSLFSRFTSDPADLSLSLLNICIPEVISVFYVLEHKGKLTQTQRDALKGNFIGDLRAARLDIHSVDGKDIRAADDVIDIASKLPSPRRRGAKAHGPRRVGCTDILVISVAVRMTRQFRQTHLISSDKHMIRVAKQLGVDVINPEKVAQLPWQLSSRTSARLFP